MTENPNVRGINVLRDPHLNKDLAFSHRERHQLGVQGLLPPAVQSPELQVRRCLEILKNKANDLERYLFLVGLLDQNERLFYRLVTHFVEAMMPLIYTPTVGLACQSYSMVITRPKGLFITIHDMAHIESILTNWPEKKITAICVTDGERILGLGDQGACGMGIPVGKLALYSALAGVPPHECLPITLDVGTENQKFLDDPFYIGLRQHRVRGDQYDQLIDAFMRACGKVYGPQVLIQFEDFGNQNAFRLLQKYRDHYCTFNDDIQGTAAVTVSGLISSTRITKKKLVDNIFLFQGAGEANIGIGMLLAAALMSEGLDQAAAYSRIFMVDSKGLIVADRPSGGLSGHKMLFAHKRKPVDKLEDVVREIRPTALIGAAAVPGAFTTEIIRMMTEFNERPIIFALSNPTHKAECTAEQAYTHSKGRCVFASGSPFDPVSVDGKQFHPGQGNNSYIFPGVGLAVVAGHIRPLPDELFLESARALSDQVTEDDLALGRVYPPLSSIRQVSLQIGLRVLQMAYDRGLARYYPEPPDMEAFLRHHVYSTDYPSLLPTFCDYEPNTKI